MGVTEPGHLGKALRWSLQGLGRAWKSQVAFRMELCGLAGVAVVLALLRPGPLWSGLLGGAALLVPAVELLNSALEEICNLITREYNERIKHAKDMGSAAVLLALLLNAVLWAAMLWNYFIA